MLALFPLHFLLHLPYQLAVVASSSGDAIVFMGDAIVLLGDAIVLLGDAIVFMGDAIVFMGDAIVLLGDAIVLLGDAIVFMGDAVAWQTMRSLACAIGFARREISCRSTNGSLLAIVHRFFVLASNTKAMVLPTVADVQNIPSPSPGMMVYINKAGAKRLAVYNGSKWSFWKP